MTARIVRGSLVVVQDGTRWTGLGNGAVYIEGDRIISVGSYEVLRRAHPLAPVEGGEEFWVIPGLICAHDHGRGLSTWERGLADGSLESWLLGLKALAPVDAFVDTVLSASTLLRTGVTTTIHTTGLGGDALEYRGRLTAIGRAYQSVGLRYILALACMDRNYLSYGGDDSFIATLPRDLGTLARGLLPKPGEVSCSEVLQHYREMNATAGWGPLGGVALAPVGPQWCSDAAIRAALEIAGATRAMVHLHLLESGVQRGFGPRVLGRDVASHLDALGLLGPSLVAAHAVWLTADDVALLAHRRVIVVHNPSSNLRLRNGVAPIAALAGAGVPLAIGLDSMSCDLFEEMRLALRLVQTLGSADLNEHWAFSLATTGGARAAGDHTLGTLMPGGKADLVLLAAARFAGPHGDSTDPVAAIIQRGRPADVARVMVGGEWREPVPRGNLNPLLPVDDTVRDRRAAVQALLPYLESYYQGWADAEPPAGRPLGQES